MRIRRYWLARALANMDSFPVVSTDDLRDAEWRHLNAPTMAFLYEDESTRPHESGIRLVEAVRCSASRMTDRRLAFTLDNETGRVAIWRIK